jgi:DTW domain-containing protein YfiP
LPDCLCALIPRIETRTRVVLILHQLEERKTSNTGRLAVRCLPNSRVLVRGGRDCVPDTSAWRQTDDAVLLFPHPDAKPIESWRDHPRPITLLVPDGTWRQARRARARVAGLADLPCARVTRAAPSTYRLRTASEAGQLATMEAIAEALGALEGPDARAQLLGIFDVMVDRSLRHRHPSVRDPGRPG